MTTRREENNKSINIPQDLWEELINRYKAVVSRYRVGDFEHHETSVGKFCEVVVRIFEYALEGTYTPIDGQNPDTKNIVNKVINSEGGNVDVTVRRRVAPLVRVLLSFRNERDAAHVGGFDLGAIDTNFTFYATRWIYAEIIRIYGNLEAEQIQRKIDDVAVIEFPELFKVGSKKVITNPRLTSEEEIRLSLKDGEKPLDELFEMNKEQNKARFKGKLENMIKRKLIYYHSDTGRYILLPEGRK